WTSPSRSGQVTRRTEGAIAALGIPAARRVARHRLGIVLPGGVRAPVNTGKPIGIRLPSPGVGRSAVVGGMPSIGDDLSEIGLETADSPAIRRGFVEIVQAHALLAGDVDDPAPPTAFTSDPFPLGLAEQP